MFQRDKTAIFFLSFSVVGATFEFFAAEYKVVQTTHTVIHFVCFRPLKTQVV